MKASLVLFETAGNQPFVFATNKLTDNVGASQLIEESGSAVVLQAVERIVGRVLTSPTRAGTRALLRDRRANPPIDSDGAVVEVVFATSGTALLVASTDQVARAVIGDVTGTLLDRAPGLEMTGVHAPVDLSTHDIGEALRQAHHALAAARSARAQAVRRFPRLPFAAPCQHSGLPAAAVRQIGDSEARLSRSSIVKRDAASRWQTRLRQVLAAYKHVQDLAIPTTADALDALFDDLDWTAVVHADGNRVGSVFRNFDRASGAATARDFIDRLRAFSLTLEEVTERALCDAFHHLRDPDDPSKLRGIPLLLGGDDFTILCDGRRALPFAEAYLQAFARHSSDQSLDDGNFWYIANEGLHACAGVAITKPHFPFSSAYDLAEALTASAKRVVRTPSAKAALDFHILFDSTHTGLRDIRRSLDRSGVTLTRKPYAVSGGADASSPLAALQARVKAIRQGTGIEGALPNSQLHDLREALFHGKAVADARLANVFDRYKAHGLDELVEARTPAPSLFGADNRTAFLDALESAPFWGM